MANITAGQLFPWSLSRTSAVKDPLRITSENYGAPAKLMGLDKNYAGPKSISGITFTNISRKLLLLAQGPPAVLIGVTFSNYVNGTYSFKGLSAKYKYIVIDLDVVSGRDQAMILDQISPGP